MVSMRNKKNYHEILPLILSSACNVAEALYLNKQFNHLFLILGTIRWKA